MRVRTIRGEIINLDLVKIYQLDGDSLLIKDESQIQKYTLTAESKKALETYVRDIK